MNDETPQPRQTGTRNPRLSLRTRTPDDPPIIRAGPVTITRPDGTQHVQAAYSDEERQRVIDGPAVTRRFGSLRRKT